MIAITPILPQQEAPPWPKTLTNSIGMEFVLIPAGAFRMGTLGRGTGRPADRDEYPAHHVQISRPFYLGKYEVTQAQWKAVMGGLNNPSRFQGHSRPVDSVSWKDVETFIRNLRVREDGVTYRLPTEAEWEYAARAGSTTAYSFGDHPRELDAYEWYRGNSGGESHAVGQLKPNAWGLYDMHGNVREWVQDWYSGAYYTQSPTRDPQGPSSGSHRVARGGSGGHPVGFLRSANRSGWPPGRRHPDFGFRLLRTAPAGVCDH